MKIRHFAAFTALAFLTVATLPGCGKIKLPFGKKEAVATPATPVAAPASAPTSTTAPAPAAAPASAPTSGTSATGPSKPAEAAAPKPAVPAAAIDRNAQVVVLCYHRLEGKAGGALSIDPALFEKQMQEIKDRGLAVISMQDFLAWRRGEKNIPPKSILITLDDGYVSSIEVGVPILKKHSFPATFFVYLEYINKGGKSVNWGQLGQLRDEGFEIGSHTVSHEDLRIKSRKTKLATHEAWLKDEVERSKQVLEEQLGIRVATIAYPFGNHNPKVHDAVKAAGYDLGFTTYGQRVGMTSAAYSIGRYDVTSKDAQGHDGFTAAISFQGAAATSGPVMAQDAQALMITEPMNGAVVNTLTPTLRANLASLGAIDPASLKVRVAGVGIIPANFDPKTKQLSYTFTQPIRPGNVSVIVSASAGNQPVETRWSFTVDPAARPNSPDTAELPPRRGTQ